MKSKVVEQVEEILKRVTAVEDIAEIERVIAEAKGKILVEPAAGFWEGKRPCWEICHCPESTRSQCPAPQYPFLPCWEIEGTYLKLSDDVNNGDDTSICRICRVYRRYGQGKPIEIRLRDKGLDSHCRSLKEKCQTSEYYGEGEAIAGCPSNMPCSFDNQAISPYSDTLPRREIRSGFNEFNRREAMNTDIAHSMHESGTKARSALGEAKHLIGRVKHLIGKVVSVDEDWISKSKDWPYLWRK